jgi:hypothetical protein
MPKELKVSQTDSLKDVLKTLVGGKVELTLRSGQSYSGKLAMVGEGVVRISELFNKEFYDAIVSTADIVAFEVRVRDA